MCFNQLNIAKNLKEMDCDESMLLRDSRRYDINYGTQNFILYVLMSTKRL